MKRLHWMILAQCGMVLLITVLFFVMLLELLDIFANLWSYIDSHTPLADILAVFVAYLPTCLSYVLPVALLFSVSYTLGTLYANNELIAVLGGGMSFFSLILPVLAAGFLLSVFVFFFEEKVVIPSVKSKTDLQNAALKRGVGQVGEHSEIGFIDRDKNILVKADAYNTPDNSLSGVTVMDRNTKRITYTDRAVWDGRAWLFPAAWVYEFNQDRSLRTSRRVAQYQAAEITQTPEKFKLKTSKVEEMELDQASAWIRDMEDSGVPTQAAQTGFFNKFSYALRVFIVTIIAASVGGAFRKNILLMCLLSSLVISVGFFVFQLVTDALAKNSFLPPAVGAFLPIVVFTAVGAVFMTRTRT